MQDGNRGWRRAIASPQPVRVIEAPIIERLAREGVMIIACGGGGIAVEELANGELRGLEAVIDKDRASALLAIEMQADLLMIPTGVAARGDPLRPARPAVARPHHGGAGRGATRPRDTSAPAAWGRRSRPCCSFVKGRAGGRGVITNVENIERALRGETGTWIESLRTVGQRKWKRHCWPSTAR